jgi:hypothetical protein
MFNDTFCEVRRAEHWGRVDRVNREGWKRETSVSTERRRTLRQIGQALVRFGERLQGTPAERRASSPAIG